MPEEAIRWRIEETEPFDAERESAFLYLLRLAGPDYAGRWLVELVRVIAALAQFPGPRSHPVDEKASEQFNAEIRRMLYDGPSHRRRSTARYRILFKVIDPVEGENEGAIVILRIRHGAASDEA